MNKLLDVLSAEAGAAFAAAGYDENLGKVTVSNRPDLCEFQCNGAMAGAKLYKKAPIMIANEVAEKLSGCKAFSEVNAIAPGFLNLKLSEAFLADYLNEMNNSEKFGYVNKTGNKKVVIDYGGPNVAKALHVGHLRSAVIGEAVKRIYRYTGNDIVGDIHMGDWGTPMGLVIHEIQERMPDLPYFDENYEGEYPAESPVTIKELEEIYPTASSKSKVDEAYKAAATQDTYKLQSGVRGHRALWNKIMEVSVADLKKNYDRLNVSFEEWNGESTVHDLIPSMVEDMKKGGYAYYSDGALVVDVKREDDKKEVPPCIILKSDGAALYNTTDLATIKMRMDTENADEIIYLTDKRQELYFEQVFRCARKTKLVNEDTALHHIGFGTMNGSDGKPYKTRSGGVPRLEDLIDDINSEMYRKIKENTEAKGSDMSDEEAKKIAEIVGLAAIKYGDLSNQPAKDYIFDIDRFTSFEGDTGPYILYTMVRIKSIISKYSEMKGKEAHGVINPAGTKEEKNLCLALSSFISVMQGALEELAPNRICAFIYDVANAFNSFYHEVKILSEQDEEKQAGYIALLEFTLRILGDCIDMLGFEAPDRM